MKIKAIKQALLNNYRYWFAYIGIFVFGAYFLTWQLRVIGPGLSQVELTTAAHNASLSTVLSQPFNLLHSLLGRLSIYLFDVSTLSIRLPSIILAALTAFLAYKLIRRWFGKPTALLATLVLLSADWYLSIGRLGAASIELSFWLVLSMVAYTKLLELKCKWLPVLTLAYGALLFVPFGPYVVLILLAGQLIFGTFREKLAQAPSFLKIMSLLILLVALGGFIFSIVRVPHFITTVLVLSPLPSIHQFFLNIVHNSGGIIALIPSRSALLGPTGMFIVRFFELIFIMFGIAMLWHGRKNRLGLMVLVLGLFFTILSGLSSGPDAAGLQLVIAILLIATALRHLLHRWQKAFPRNPYARIVAFLSLSFLLIAVLFMHYQTYFVLWPSQTTTHQVFNSDFLLVQDELKAIEGNSVCTVVTTDKNYITLLQKSPHSCQLQFTDTLNMPLPPGSNTIVAPDTDLSLVPEANPKSLVNGLQDKNVRWLVLRVNQ